MKSRKNLKEPVHEPGRTKPLEQSEVDTDAAEEFDASDDPSDLDDFGDADDDDSRWDVFLFDDDSDPLPEHGDFWLPD
jgi:hypothetical protein